MKMTRSPRALMACFLCLLLLGMQQEGLRHALTHWASTLTADQKQSLQARVNVPCVECTLLAAGSDALATSAQVSAVAAVVATVVSWTLRASPSFAPSYY